MDRLNPVPEITSIHKKEEIKKDNISVIENTTYDLFKILCQTKLQSHQQKAAVTEGCNIGINISHVKHIEDNEKSVIDESVIINEPEISIIDLTNENACAATETTAFQLEINKNNQDYDSVIDLTDDNTDEILFKNMAKIHADKEHKINVEVVKEYTANAETAKQKNTNAQMDIESITFVNKAVHLIPLPSKNDHLSEENNKSVVTKTQTIDSENRNNKIYINTATQLETNEPMEIVENKSSMNVGLVNSNNQSKSDMATVLQPANHEPINKLLPDQKKINNMFDTKVTSKVIDKIVEIVWDTRIELENTSKTNETKNENGILSQADGTKTDIEIASKSNTIENKSTKETNIVLTTSDNKTKESITSPEIIKTPKLANQVIRNKEGVKDVSTTSTLALKDSAPNNNKNKLFESITAKEVLDKMVETVWDTKNGLEITKTNDTKTEIEKPPANDTKNEIGNAPKTSSIEKKVINHCSIGSQFKTLVTLLEKRIQGYLSKNIRIIKHIRHGKYSNVFSCKDSKGQMYAAKVLKYVQFNTIIV